MALLRTRRFDLVETALIAVTSAFAGFLAFGAAVPYVASELTFLKELRPFAATYGPERESQRPEEWLIRNFFQDRRGGFFLDVGANHYRIYSNTYFLEVELGWEGIAVEPLIEFEADYATYRPRTRFRPFFVSDISDAQATLYSVDRDHRISSGVADFTGRSGDEVKSRTVPTITLNDLLEAEGIDRIDLLTMDIELWEPKALAGFDVKRYRPELVCIEGQPEVRQDILDYFAASGYVVVGRYLRADIWNLYFTPQASAGGPVRRNAS
ncbi:MAG TPA: FkbM family methyltransferase [Vicinamibacterales bacterium]|nr:FkbM family methyltransferase [Vicinamibacterales bacterium]